MIQKHLKIIIVILGSLLIGVISLVIYIYPQHTSTVYYANLEAALKERNKGWISDFIPDSAIDIYEKHNYDSNRGLVAFSIRPEEFERMISYFKKVPDNQLNQIGPWIKIKEPWWPDYIKKGKISHLKNHYKYDIYQTTGESLTSKWYLAINPEHTQCYMWH